MEKDLDLVIIKTTQSTLGKYVKRPPLTEKLLKKPPFRFLHDIVTSVLKTTGFFDGLFDEEELISDNVKDRESKLAFLNKVITVVGLTTGKTLAVKPSKIVAGQEPDKTNELLQCLALALDKNLSSDEAVKKIKESSKVSKSDEKRSKDPSKQIKKGEVNKLTSKSSEKLTNNRKETGTRSSNKNDAEKGNTKAKKDKNTTKSESPSKKTSQQTKLVASKKPSMEKKKIEALPNRQDGSDEKGSLLDIGTMHAKNELASDMENQPRTETMEITTSAETFQTEQNNHDSSYTIADNALNSSLSSQDLMEVENLKNDEHNKVDQEIEVTIHSTEQDKMSGNVDDIVTDNDSNEQTDNMLNKASPNRTINRKIEFKKDEEKVNPDPSTIKSPKEVKNIVRPLSVRPSSSRPGAPRPRDKHDNMIIEAENILVGKVNIIAESSPNEEEEDTSIVVMEQESTNTISIQEEHEQLHASLNEHGHLVQQILESQKEYSQMSGKTEIEWQFGAQKARDALNKELEQLRFDIQALSRVANPLGKLMDHIQEDVEVMRQELNQWSKTYDETSKELFKQKAANEDSLLPLYTKVKQLGTEIEEKHDKINDLKIIMHKNSQRIDKLLANGIVQ